MIAPAMDLELPSRTALADLSNGDSVGPWRIEGELGRGGMSTVYAVVHSEIEKRAALKVVHGNILSPAFPPARILLEAQVVNRIAHSNIVDIFENGELPDGRPFLVMERLYGCSLEQQLDAGRISTDEVIGILLQICSALTAAHDAAIVHCDLKPDNVFLVGERNDPNRRVKVLDWGIAQVITRRAQTGRSEQLIGTPRYVSPEQVQGGAPSPASDIYALGVMAYELFLEEQLFQADSSAEILKMHLNTTPPAPEELWPGIPPALSSLLMSMLAKAPHARPTASEVACSLEGIRDELRRRSAAQVRPVSAELVDEVALVLAGDDRVVPAPGGGDGWLPPSPVAPGRRPSRYQRLTRFAQRRFSRVELAAATAAIILVAVVGAAFGYQQARAGDESLPAITAGMPAAMPAIATSIVESLPRDTPPPQEASDELVSDAGKAGPRRSAKSAAKPVAAAPTKASASLRSTSVAPAAGAASNKPAAARRTPARPVSLDGTLEPY
jgi:tRNA A-37 threonylcarbamoyl transferase component Bud32